MNRSHQNAGGGASKNTGIPALCQGSAPDPAALWSELRHEAGRVVEEESLLRHLVDDVILSRPSMGSALATRLARRLSREDMPREQLHEMFDAVIGGHPALVDAAARDLLAIFDRDPACCSLLEPLLFSKGFLALTTYRVSHQFWNEGRRWLALYLQSAASEAFAVDIHPAAKIGCGILLDHATSFVVGETAIIEDEVSILHEVTLGGTGKEGGQRHPIIRKGVLLGAGAKILGRVEIGAGAKVGAGSVVLADVPAHTTVAGVPAVVVGGCASDKPAIDMDQRLNCP